MTTKSLGASLAAMLLVSTLSVGCSNTAEKYATRAEDAAKRAEAAAEKAERLFSKHMHK